MTDEIKRVLVVDDDEQIRSAFARSFKIRGVEAVTCDSVDGAIDLLRSPSRVDAVLCDYNVVGGTGDRVLAWVRERRPQLAGRFVFLSDDDKAGNHGVPHLRKPCLPSAVMKALGVEP